MGQLARPGPQLQPRRLVLRSALALAARPDREPEPPMAWWFPRGTDLAGIAPANADDLATLINGQRCRSLNYQSPTTLYAAFTVHRPMELAVLQPVQQ